MSKKRIEDNPSYQKIKKELEGAEAIRNIAKFLSFFGLKNAELEKAFSALPDFRMQIDLLSKSLDKFNDHFAQRGWIAHESMNSDLMLIAIEFAEKGQIELAETELINYYSSDKIQFLLYQLRFVDAFSIRYEFFKLAYEDTIAERYHAVVPVLLMMIDGAVNDIDKGKGFFADNTDLTAWDSIAAHSTGLTELKVIFSDNRTRTTDDIIDLPYRHGILHGRDLGYANKTVCAKCWAAVFAIKDWAVALKQGKKNPPPPESELTLKENIYQLKESLDRFAESKKQSEITSIKVAEWKPRILNIGIDIPENGTSSEYIDFTPEQEAIRFFEYWKKNNFGSISKQIHNFSKTPSSEKKEAGKVRKILGDKKLKNYKITNVNDCSPAISEITFEISLEYENSTYEKQITLRFIYEGLNGDILVIGDQGGQWKFIENFFHKLEYIY